MIWALLISIIFSGNDPAFILPELEKQVRRYVDDKERKEQILEIRKASEKRREKYLKANKKIRKQFDKQIRNNNTPTDVLTNLLEQGKKERNEMQAEEIERVLLVKSLITEQEWDNFISNSEKEINKIIQQKDKELKDVQKLHRRAQRLVDAVFKEDSANCPVGCAIDELFFVSVKSIELYYSYYENKESIIYQYKVSREDIINVVELVNKADDKTLEAMIESHKVMSGIEFPNKQRKLFKLVSGF